jgi:signal transduction histidine kinase
MFVALLGLTLWAYLGVRHILMQQLDDSLRGSAQLQLTTLAGMQSLAPPADLTRDWFVRDVNRFVVVRDSAGRVLGGNSVRARELPLHPIALAECQRTGFWFTTHPWGGRSFRSIYLATIPGSATAGRVVQVSASLLPLETSLHTILIQMLATVLLGTLATAIGAGWLADSAIAPVREITQQARSITGEVPGQRITAHASVSEFRGLTEVINAMVARLEQASEWHRRMIRDLGHDLRTPVTALRAGVEVALWHERSPEDYRRVLGSTLEEIDRLTLICDALRLLARLQAGEVSLDPEILDARALAREAVMAAQECQGAHSVSVSEPGGPVLIRADRRLIRMVLDQLLDNARRYTPADSRIVVEVRAEGAEAVITVEDDGPGVADEVLPHLFEPFYRSDTARAREGGPGLGLTATHAIITLHGGTVVASRAPEGGLRVKATLPRAHPSLIDEPWYQTRRVAALPS